MASICNATVQSHKVGDSSDSFPQIAFLRLLEITARSYGLLPVVPTRQRRYPVCPRKEQASVRVIAEFSV